MKIRGAELEDLAAVCTCCVEAFKDYITLIGRIPGPMLEDYGRAMEEGFLFVAEEDGRILGFLLIKEGEGGFMWMDILATQPRGRGVGTVLMDFCEDFIRCRGSSECRLYTNVKFDRTREIYLHRGYEIYDRVQEYGFDRYYMRKALDGVPCKS
ncbi:MAG: GNAT family N-acetyltransferase [Ruminiclostridium sp.]|nr:GNAT family N-acetyltransferase [Ruminiclostridium sp.]